MKRRLFFVFSAVAVVATGCSHFKKNPKPKENPAIAADTDANFRQRFLIQRAGELVAQGLSEEAARVRAAEEFNARYGYTSSAKK
jgi:lipoprotein NlpI